jgi:predicted DNA-binding protein (MmcQ/YjbR family)
MVPDVSKISGIGAYTEKTEEIKDGENVKTRTLYLKDDKAFLVINQNTIELRTDQKLAKLLEEKYESVMESRYFGRGGIEIVPAGQLEDNELEDLVRLSYNLS